MESWEIIYFMRPDAENIVIRIPAEDAEEAAVFAKQLRKDPFMVRKART